MRICTRYEKVPSWLQKEAPEREQEVEQPGPATSFAVGISSNGEHWVDFNHKCSRCKHPMPLPDMEGKFCPNCGDREPTFRERREALEAAAQRLGITCPQCQAERQCGNYCTECGAKLPPKS